MNMMPSDAFSQTKLKSGKIDAIRFLAAFWVLVFHLQPPEFSKLVPSHFATLGRALQSLSVSIFNGPAAVIVFFVISGYCIHSAYHREATLGPINYFVSRFVRIGLPLVVALALVQALDVGSDPVDSVLWSLYCEMIYYAVYPFIRAKIRFMGELIIAAFLCGATLIFAFHFTGRVACPNCVRETYGIPGTALLYSCAWIFGAFVAEHQQNAQQFEATGRYSTTTTLFHRALTHVECIKGVWLIGLRVVVVSVGTLTMALWSTSRHKPAFLPFVHPDICLFLFQPFAVIWIAAEGATGSNSRAWIWLGRLGVWSYSLYLCHKTAIVVVNAASFSTHPGAAWFGQVAVALATSYGFYQIVEHPSHLLAKRLRRVGRVKAPIVGAPSEQSPPRAE
jgi:peptidoglycan/LPS O-acetylase OafA/YrhL